MSTPAKRPRSPGSPGDTSRKKRHEDHRSRDPSQRSTSTDPRRRVTQTSTQPVQSPAPPASPSASEQITQTPGDVLRALLSRFPDQIKLILAMDRAEFAVQRAKGTLENMGRAGIASTDQAAATRRDLNQKEDILAQLETQLQKLMDSQAEVASSLQHSSPTAMEDVNKGLNEMSRIVTTSCANIETLSRTSSSHNARFDEIKAHLQRLEDQLQSNKQENSKLHRSLQNYQSANQTLRGEMEDLTKKYIDTGERLTRSENANRELKEQTTKLSKQLSSFVATEEDLARKFAVFSGQSTDADNIRQRIEHMETSFTAALGDEPFRCLKVLKDDFSRVNRNVDEFVGLHYEEVQELKKKLAGGGVAAHSSRQMDFELLKTLRQEVQAYKTTLESLQIDSGRLSKGLQELQHRSQAQRPPSPPASDDLVLREQASMEQRIDNLQIACTELFGRYNNLTTENLVKGVMQVITRNYPMHNIRSDQIEIKQQISEITERITGHEQEVTTKLDQFHQVQSTQRKHLEERVQATDSAREALDKLQEYTSNLKVESDKQAAQLLSNNEKLNQLEKLQQIHPEALEKLKKAIDVQIDRANEKSQTVIRELERALTGEISKQCDSLEGHLREHNDKHSKELEIYSRNTNDRLSKLEEGSNLIASPSKTIDDIKQNAEQFRKALTRQHSELRRDVESLTEKVDVTNQKIRDNHEDSKCRFDEYQSRIDELAMLPLKQEKRIRTLENAVQTSSSNAKDHDGHSPSSSSPQTGAQPTIDLTNDEEAIPNAKRKSQGKAVKASTASSSTPIKYDSRKKAASDSDTISVQPRPHSVITQSGNEISTQVLTVSSPSLSMMSETKWPAGPTKIFKLLAPGVHTCVQMMETPDMNLEQLEFPAVIRAFNYFKVKRLLDNSSSTKNYCSNDVERTAAQNPELLLRLKDTSPKDARQAGLKRLLIRNLRHTDGKPCYFLIDQSEEVKKDTNHESGFKVVKLSGRGSPEL